MEHYCTAREAQRLLGMHVGTFYYLVETGKIKKLVLPGKQWGVYSKHQIQKLAKEQRVCPGGKEEQGIVFQKATIDDLYEEYELATLMLSGGAGYGFPSYAEWLGKNPDTNFIVRDQGRLVAFIHAIPVEHNTIQYWMRGEIGGWEIRAQDVLFYAPGSTLECIIMSMATISDVDEQRRRLYGACLLRGFFHFLCGLAEQDITITRFYAMSATSKGNAMLRKAKFVERGHVGKRVAFELDPLTSDTRMAQEYRANLACKFHEG
jgi:hypothetical protein